MKNPDRRQRRGHQVNDANCRFSAPPRRIARVLFKPSFGRREARRLRVVIAQLSDLCDLGQIQVVQI